MKKIFFLVVCLLAIINVRAASTINELEITYVNNELTTNTRSYTNNRYIFDIEYVADVTNLTQTQIEYALNQKSNDYLKVFGKLNVKITPNKNGIYKNINDKIFVGISKGTFGNTITDDVIPNDVASLYKTSFEIQNPIMEVFYREDENSAWKNDATSLTGEKTLENQLATLLNIDLNQDPNGVIDSYNKLYYFKPLENMTYTNRIDFYDKTENVTIENAENNEYDISALKKINTEYAILRFKPLTSTTFNQINQKPNILPYIISVTLILCSCTFYYLKSKKLI